MGVSLLARWEAWEVELRFSGTSRCLSPGYDAKLIRQIVVEELAGSDFLTRGINMPTRLLYER